MKILHELSWLWETLGIALVAAAVCVACAALIGKAAKKKLSKKLLAVIGAAAFVGAILAVILIARTPIPGVGIAVVAAGIVFSASGIALTLGASWWSYAASRNGAHIGYNSTTRRFSCGYGQG